MSQLQTTHDNQTRTSVDGLQFGGLLPSILISAVSPLVIYWLVSPHTSTLAALALTAIPPMLYSIYGWLRAHSIDGISIISLCMIAASMLLALLSHDLHLFLLKDSYMTGTFGLLCLLSLVTSKPAAYYVYKWVFVRTPEQLASLLATWQIPYGRFARRLVTAVWGLVFIGETLTDTFLVYHLPTSQFLAIHPFLFWGTLFAAFGMAIVYSKHAQKKIASLRNQI